MIDQFSGINVRHAATENKASLLYALSLGISIGLQNGLFSLLYLATAELYARWPEYEYTGNERTFICMFVYMFGAFTAANASALGPDIGKAKKAAVKIFSIIERPTKIDALAKAKTNPPTELFNGTIEFRNVWFRYPARLEKWVFKGLNLKIE